MDNKDYEMVIAGYKEENIRLRHEIAYLKTEHNAILNISNTVLKDVDVNSFYEVLQLSEQVSGKIGDIYYNLGKLKETKEHPQG